MISENSYTQDDVTAFEQAFNGRQAMMWTALPGIVTKFDPTELTCEVQPAVQGKIVREDGGIDVVNLPLLLDCPVLFPHAGGCSLTFPIKAGDEVLVVFASRGIDYWWAYGGTQPPAETRMHDLSDGFVIPGPWSQPKRLQNASTSRVELRSDDGEALISVHPSTHEVTVETSGALKAVVGGTMEATSSGAVTLKCPTLKIDCPQVSITGTLSVQGNVTGAGISLNSHVHGGVQGGPSNTGGPK